MAGIRRSFKERTSDIAAEQNRFDSTTLLNIKVKWQG